ncbi:MerR family transcriptional regulator [Desulfurivibrio sp. D14AmB]|uniref:MerR family transcriptional regulator n=1 Tax=Desulfurivibrio sp. D14AmB TaxID=3374370 RepID=UPI00376EF945
MDQATPIPDKLYFKIGEVCEITGVKQHVLRYWESEFRILSPQRANSRQRLYRRGDVENILRIKRLLKEEGFTISGAKKLLARERRGGAASPALPTAAGTGPAKEERPGPPSAAAPEPAAGGEKTGVTSLFGGIKQELLDLQKILER